MQKLASELLDFYDDPRGVVFKKRFPDPGLLPDYIKQARLLSADDRKGLSDDLFALVIEEDGEKLKKYAMNDKANAALSVIYFLDVGAKKLGDSLAKTAATNLVTGCGWYKLEPPTALAKIARGEIDQEVTKISGLGATAEVKLVALPGQDKYPLDSYRDTQKAVEFFDKYASKFHPRERREYALNVQKRANDLGIPVTQSIQLYASDTMAEKDKVANQIYMRMEKTAGQDRQRYAAFFEKIASVPAGVAGETLALLDESVGLDTQWDGALLDPFQSVLSIEKQAQNYAFHDPNGSITDEEIQKLVDTQQLLIEKAFSKEFYDTLKSDPVNIFKSLPLPEKRTLIRLKTSASLS